MHVYLNWTKQRMAEMDATLASLEAKATQVKTDSKVKADQLIADLKKRRDEFKANAKAQAQASDAALHTAKVQLESQWKGFETQVQTYFDTVGKHIELQKTTFHDVAAAQTKAWREAAEKLQAEAAKVTAAKRADIDAAVKQIKADATEAEARLQKLKQAGGESWAVLSGALAESRKTFDQASQKAWETFKRASAA